MEPRLTPLEPTLLWIVTGYRVFAALWLTILGIATVASPGARSQNPQVVWATIALVLTWAGMATVLRVLRPAVAVAWWFIAVDLVISCWSVIAGEVAGTIQFAGGYPLVGAFAAIYAFGWGGAIVGAIVLTAIGMGRVVGGEEPIAQDVANSIAYLFSVGAVGGVAAAFRLFEQRRLAAEAALEKERTERIRAEEHAEVAAHLHDSVLQTLALIQRDPDSTPDIRGLARHQERELRTWLFPGQAESNGGPGGFREDLVAVCSEVEDLGSARIELVVVGNTAAPVDPIVRAAREAVLNASKHSGAETVSVYGEVGDDLVQVFVKDRGAGFDLASVPKSRQGIRESIVHRMERHGGAAEVISAAGEGTEIRLQLPIGES